MVIDVKLANDANAPKSLFLNLYAICAPFGILYEEYDTVNVKVFCTIALDTDVDIPVV